MKTVEKLKSAKRFGTRYGPRNKIKVAKIEEESRKKHKCPYCRYQKVKRVAAGIWQCRKCNKKFTGKAYSIEKKITFEEEQETPVFKETEPEEKEELKKEEIEA